MLNKPREAFRYVFIPAMVTLTAFIVTYTIYLLFGQFDIFSHLPLAVSDFCELFDSGMIKQHTNTWTNLAYLFFGVLLFLQGWEDSKSINVFDSNTIRKFPLFSYLLGGSLIYLYFGSSLFHASYTKISQNIDISGVISTTMLPVFYLTFKIFTLKFNPKPTLFLYKGYYGFIIGYVLLNMLLFILGVPSRMLMVGLVAAIMGLTGIIHWFWKIDFNYTWFLISVSTIFFSLGIWLLDRYKVICSPDSIWQLHGLWHITTAFSLYSIYYFFRTEKKIN